MAKTQKVSKEGEAFIAEHEGLRLRAYPDPGTGGEPWTIGYGHTGNDVRPGSVITIEKARQHLTKDIERHAREVRRVTNKAKIPQAAFDALVSFDFNTGALHRSTLLRKHNAGDHSGAAREFHRWFYSGGRPMPGLKKRRAAEAKLYADAYAGNADCK